jgi:hypothetical protein
MPTKRQIFGTPHTWDDDMQAWVPKMQFLKGPIPWPWIVRAWSLPGQSLMVGLMLWRLAGLKKRKDGLLFGNNDCLDLSICPATKSRALKSLEQAGLIKVDREPGRLPVVTIIEDV